MRSGIEVPGKNKSILCGAQMQRYFNVTMEVVRFFM